MIPFALADIKNNFLGTPFFEKYMNNIHIQDFTMKITHSCNDQPAIASFTKLNENIFPLISFTYQKT